MLKRAILFSLFLLGICSDANAQFGTSGWSAFFRKTGNTISQGNTIDTVQVTQFRYGSSSTAGYVLTVDARGVVTAADVTVAGGAGDITSVVAGAGLTGGATSGAATLDIGAGTAITVNANDIAVTANAITATQLADALDLGGESSFEVPNGAAPTVDAFGELAGDNDLWAASRGAPVFFDGTASTALVNVLVSDAPSNTQSPVWNTGGTITWETPASPAATYITKTADGSLSAEQAIGALSTGILKGTTTSGTITSLTTLVGIDTVVTDLDLASAATGAMLIRRASGVWVDSIAVYGRTIQFSVDSAAGIASDTMWVWQNLFGASVTVDSIHVAASSDDYALSIVKCNNNGGGGALVDAVTASTNGTNLFLGTETTITSATITSMQRIGFKRPASTGDRVYVRIHYH